MALSRRSILKGLATAPVGAKQASKEIADMAGVSVVGGMEPEPAHYGVAVQAGSNPMFDFVKRYGVPNWRKEEIRKEARWSRTLDADIACMRSLSLDAKLRKQWARNEERLERDWIDNLFNGDARDQWWTKWMQY